MQITVVAVFLLSAMGGVATPINSRINPVDARAETGILITYEGTCSRAKNECKYKNQNNKDTFVKCPSFANKKCTKDNAKCSFDSYSRAVTCH
uniref:Antifungal protein n=1 Tax=Epichloe festucae TaxID=35717 RepID=A0A2U9ACP7_9HYPO|nr:antifungal protein [Epichloe festucae]